ncbi:MAG: hemerythrin domain-containing protein [Terriglobales bacterium]|jgi:hemerythrin-like domain-containing protein
MLNSIRTNSSPSAEVEDAVSLLLGCHERIRHFTAVAVRLAESQQAPASERIQAARAVLRYYAVALPLHEADENESVYPRMKNALLSSELANANEQMIEQHKNIDATVAELIPMWQEVEHDPEGQDALALNDRLRDRTERLSELWSAHLKLEEEQVIPALRQHLTAEDLRAIQQEMRDRRQ